MPHSETFAVCRKTMYGQIRCVYPRAAVAVYSPVLGFSTGIAYVFIFSINLGTVFFFFLQNLLRYISMCVCSCHMKDVIPSCIGCNQYS